MEIWCWPCGRTDQTEISSDDNFLLPWGPCINDFSREGVGERDVLPKEGGCMNMVLILTCGRSNISQKFSLRHLWMAPDLTHLRWCPSSCQVKGWSWPPATFKGLSWLLVRVFRIRNAHATRYSLLQHVWNGPDNEGRWKEQGVMVRNKIMSRV